MEPEIKDEQVKELSTCVKCGEELKKISMGGSDAFSVFSMGRAAFYCESTKCDMFGYLTVGHKPKVVDVPKKD